ncbi:MAG: hypothetical protein IJ410_07070 [Oscillospiraceae bacterium]|nr:hypothetical protein [Oscillospiraceae bacterium]
MSNRKRTKYIIAAIALLAAAYIAFDWFIPGEKFCREHWIYDADTIIVNISEDVGEEFTVYELTADERKQLENWIGNMRLMKVSQNDYFDVDSLRVIGIYCYHKNGDLSDVVTVFGNSYIKAIGGDKVYKIME